MTAMQELIKELTDLKNVPHSKSVFDNAQTQAYHTCIALAKSLLAKEREQIVEATSEAWDASETYRLENSIEAMALGVRRLSPNKNTFIEQYYSSKYGEQ